MVKLSCLGHKLPIDSHAGTAIVVEAVAVTALLIGIQIHPTSFGCTAPYKVQPLM